jgi:hypothetical protein
MTHAQSNVPQLVQEKQLICRICSISSKWERSAANPCNANNDPSLYENPLCRKMQNYAASTQKCHAQCHTANEQQTHLHTNCALRQSRAVTPAVMWGLSHAYDTDAWPMTYVHLCHAPFQTRTQHFLFWSSSTPLMLSLHVSANCPETLVPRQLEIVSPMRLKHIWRGKGIISRMTFTLTTPHADPLVSYAAYANKPQALLLHLPLLKGATSKTPKAFHSRTETDTAVLSGDRGVVTAVSQNSCSRCCKAVRLSRDGNHWSCPHADMWIFQSAVSVCRGGNSKCHELQGYVHIMAQSTKRMQQLTRSKQTM